MSYLTDKLRADAAAARGDAEITHVPGQMLDDVLSKMPMKRRSMLRGSIGASLTAIFGASALSACGGGGDDTPSASTPAATENFAVGSRKSMQPSAKRSPSPPTTPAMCCSRLAMH